MATLSITGPTVTSASIADNSIVNADVNSSAAIAYSKLNLGSSIVSADLVDGTIVSADINASAAIPASKLGLTVRAAAGVPTGAPTTTELPIAFDSTAVSGGPYYWTGAAWVKMASI